MQKNKNIKILILATALIVLAGLAFYAYSSRQNNSEDNKTPQIGIEQINFDPPTEQEQQSGDQKKEEIVKDQEQKQLPETAKVVITDASQYDNEIEVRAFASNTVQNGTCEITFQKDSKTITKEVPANGDASSAPCMTLTIPAKNLGESGIWTVTVKYTNDKITGSANTEMEVSL